MKDSKTRGRARIAELAVGLVALLMGVGFVGFCCWVLYGNRLSRIGGLSTSQITVAAGSLLLGIFLIAKAWPFVTGKQRRSTPVVPSGSVRRQPLAAFVLSVLSPGAGQLYNNQLEKALFLIVTTLASFYLLVSGITGRFFWGLALTVAVLGVLRLWGLVDAVLTANRHPVLPRAKTSSWPVLLAAIVGCTLALAFMLSIQQVKTFYLPSVSMSPTLGPGDRVLADLAWYSSRPPAVGDIAIYRSPEDPSVLLAQRVVAVGGTVVEIRERALLINGTLADDPWGRWDGESEGSEWLENFGPLVVPEGSLFALGDNRLFSKDSRFFGAVPYGSLAGRFLFIYWSPDRNRIGRSL